MRKNVAGLLVVLIIGSITGESDVSRFNYAVHRFSYPLYQILDNDLKLDFNYTADRTDKTSSTFERSDQNLVNIYYNGNINGNLQFESKYILIKPKYRFDAYMSVAGTGTTRENCSIFNDTLLGLFDTSSNRNLNGRASLLTDISYQYHFSIWKLRRMAYLKTRAINLFEGEYARSDHYQQNNLHYNSSDNRIKTIRDTLKFYPEIGISNQKPVAPVYRAFEIERKLRRAKVIKDRLLIKTLYALAQLVASQEKYKINHERYQKFMMDDMEAILKTDPSVDTTQLHAFALFKAEEAVIYSAPDIYCGLKWAFNKEYFASKTNRNEQSYNTYGDNQESIKNSVSDNGPVHMTISWTCPVVSHLFYNCLLNSVYDKYDDIPFISKSKYNFGIYYFLTDRISVKAHVINLPLNYLFPSGDKPEMIICTFDFYIEDNIKLNLSLEKHYYEYHENSSDEYREYGKIYLGVHYDF